ncbi:hypothetical protein M5K25_004215 [Dendrobium thyrsiflorum]|uniref:Uncharacterized protein n=1 Tax=Dendrobium thyrsiflorum TaxID=117978 RepID=A0ABD0VLN3_DENTH
MADPERDFGIVYDDQGLIQILQSPFFDVDPEVDHTVGEYVARILDTVVMAVEDQLGTVEWRLATDSNASRSSAIFTFTGFKCSEKESKQWHKKDKLRTLVEVSFLPNEIKGAARREKKQIFSIKRLIRGPNEFENLNFVTTHRKACDDLRSSFPGFTIEAKEHGWLMKIDVEGDGRSTMIDAEGDGRSTTKKTTILRSNFHSNGEIRRPTILTKIVAKEEERSRMIDAVKPFGHSLSPSDLTLKANYALVQPPPLLHGVSQPESTSAFTSTSPCDPTSVPRAPPEPIGPFHHSHEAHGVVLQKSNDSSLVVLENGGEAASVTMPATRRAFHSTIEEEQRKYSEENGIYFCDSKFTPKSVQTTPPLRSPPHDFSPSYSVLNTPNSVCRQTTSRNNKKKFLEEKEVVSKLKKPTEVASDDSNDREMEENSHRKQHNLFAGNPQLFKASIS